MASAELIEVFLDIIPDDGELFDYYTDEETRVLRFLDRAYEQVSDGISLSSVRLEAAANLAAHNLQLKLIEEHGGQEVESKNDGTAVKFVDPMEGKSARTNYDETMYGRRYQALMNDASADDIDSEMLDGMMILN